MPRVTPWTVCAALFALALVIGTICDHAPAAEPERRGPYLVLESDFHVHTRFSDGLLSPIDAVLHARRKGLHVIAITDHNILYPARIGHWFSETFGGPTVVRGEEITTRRYHLHGIGLTRRVHPDQPLRDVMDDIHAQGGLVIVAHPTRKTWPHFVPLRHQIDAAEFMHPIAFNVGRERPNSSFRWQDLRDFYNHARAEGFDIAAIGSSDYHFFSPLGVVRTLVFAEATDEASVVAAIAAGRTVVYDLDGQPHGDPEMIALLAAEPYQLTDHDYNYHGNSTIDRITRMAGLLGLLGMVLLARRRDR